MAVSARIVGTGYQRLLARLNTMQMGAAEAARARFLIGSSLPYASHWIEEGWRDDPRYGVVSVRYRQPPETWFMRDAAQQFGSTVGLRRPSELAPVGAVFDGATMLMYADTIADNMRANLNARVYSAPVPTRNGRARWQRSHQLYNSIKAFRA